MLTTHDHNEALLRRRLLDRLRLLAADQASSRRATGIHPHGRQLFSYCAFTIERLAQVEITNPIIGIVISGEKEVWLGDAGRRLSSGDVFVLTGGVADDVVNIPSERTGIYETLIVEIAQMPSLPAGPAPAADTGASSFEIRVRLTPDLVDALGHAAITLSASNYAETLAEHRLAEILMLLRGEPAARALFEQSLAERITRMVLGEPSRRWTVAEVAGRLGIGASTLRRRLAEDGNSLREILAAARMQLAREILSTGRGGVVEAAEAAGYASRSHFARRFRSIYGVAPGQLRTASRA